MSQPPPPYTGKPAPAAGTPTPPPIPMPLPPVVPWHLPALLIGVGALAAVTAVLTGVGAAGFPSAAPIEQAYALGVIVDMVAVLVAMIVMFIVERARRADPRRLGLPTDPRPSVFAILAIVFAGITFLAWVIGGGPTQVFDLAQGLRARYMYHTGGLFATGIPWALSLIFGAWGFRPGGNRPTNVLALVAVGISGVLAVVALIAALVYGAGLSD